jgi:hypothetical protein
VCQDTANFRNELKRAEYHQFWPSRLCLGMRWYWSTELRFRISSRAGTAQELQKLRRGHDRNPRVRVLWIVTCISGYQDGARGGGNFEEGCIVGIGKLDGKRNRRHRVGPGLHRCLRGQSAVRGDAARCRTQLECGRPRTSRALRQRSCQRFGHMCPAPSRRPRRGRSCPAQLSRVKGADHAVPEQRCRRSDPWSGDPVPRIWPGSAFG